MTPRKDRRKILFGKVFYTRTTVTASATSTGGISLASNGRISGMIFDHPHIVSREMNLVSRIANLRQGENIISLTILETTLGSERALGVVF